MEIISHDFIPSTRVAITESIMRMVQYKLFNICMYIVGNDSQITPLLVIFLKILIYLAPDLSSSLGNRGVGKSESTVYILALCKHCRASKHVFGI